MPVTVDESSQPSPPPPPPVLEPRPGTEAQPGPGWKRGANGNWYPPRALRLRPEPEYLDATPYESRGIKPTAVVAILVVLSLVIALVVGIVAVIRSSTEAKPVQFGSTPHAVGELAQTGDLEVTVNQVTDPYQPTKAIDVPPEGTHLVSLEVTLRNTRTDVAVDVTSARMFVLTDASGNAQELTLSTELALVDGALLPDDARRGFVVFKVPDGAKKPFKLTVKGDPTAGGVIYAIS